jgi:hypothetical protein
MGFLMSIVAPKARQHLSADALFGLVRNGFAHIPAYRLSATDIALADALMAAFALFSLKAPSLLAFDKERVEGNVHTLYGIERVPCDTSLRAILDPVSPKWLRPVCTSVFRPLQRGKALEAMTFFDGHDLLALDGTEYCASKTMHCASWLQRGHRNGAVTYAHQMLGAAIIPPDQRAVIPLRPEPMVNRDGMDKNAGARHATKRFVGKLRQDHPHLKCIIPADSLSANAPPIATLHAHDLRYILGGKEGDPAYVFQQVKAAEQAGRVTSYERHERAAGLVHRFRFVNDMPLNASPAPVRVNGIEYWERGDAQVQHCSWVTDLRVSTRNVYALMRGGRARWKREHETCKTLQNQGDHFEHNDGHGEQNLSVVFATIMRLAFLVDQTQQLCCALCRAVWAKLGSKRLVWERMRALCSSYSLKSMHELWEALWYGYERHRPLLSTDTS